MTFIDWGWPLAAGFFALWLFESIQHARTLRRQREDHAVWLRWAEVHGGRGLIAAIRQQEAERAAAVSLGERR